MTAEGEKFFWCDLDGKIQRFDEGKEHFLPQPQIQGHRTFQGQTPQNTDTDRYCMPPPLPLPCQHSRPLDYGFRYHHHNHSSRADNHH